MSHTRDLKAIQKNLNDRFKRRVVHNIRRKTQIPILVKNLPKDIRLLRIEYDLRHPSARLFYFVPPPVETITLDFCCDFNNDQLTII